MWCYSADDILMELDRNARRWYFIVLDGGKALPADCRMTVYCDENRWAFVLEQIVYAPQSPGFWGMVDLVYTIGNRVAETPSGSGDSIAVIKDAGRDRAFLDPIGLEVNPRVRMLTVRNKIVQVDLSLEHLRQEGIPIPHDGVLRGQHLLWSLLPAHRDLLFATDSEKSTRLPLDLPKFLQLEEWNHPRLMTQRTKPSQSETFRLLAEATVAGDVDRYRPTLPPNTNFRNWLHYDRV